MTRIAIAMAISFAAALVVLASSVSAVSLAVASDPGAISQDSGYSVSGDSNGRHCPCCDSLMKLCPQPSPYKWLCHSCGYCVRR